jgi:hypothetical protein
MITILVLKAPPSWVTGRPAGPTAGTAAARPGRQEVAAALLSPMMIALVGVVNTGIYRY